MYDLFSSYRPEEKGCKNVFITWLTERNYANRKVAFVENGSWAPIATKLMKECFAKGKNLTFVEETVRIMSALDEESILQLDKLAEELRKEEH